MSENSGRRYWLTALLGGTLNFVLAGPAQAHQEHAQVRDAEIVVSASGSVTLAPDHAVVVFGVVTSDQQAARAAELNAERVAEVTDTLEALGFHSDSVVTVRYSVRPQYEAGAGRRRVVGHAAEMLKQVQLNDLTRVGLVIDAVLAAGANEVPSISFRSTRQTAARLEAIQKAMDAARTEATALAEAAGGSLGRLIEAGTTVARPFAGRAMAVEAASFSETTITPPSLSVSATVTVRWQFVPRR